MNVIFNISLCFHAHAWNMSAFLFYTIPSIRLIHPSLFCIFCKFFEIRCSNSASYFKCQISMSSIIPYLLILYVLSKLHDRIKHFSIFLRCKRTAPHRILSCIWVISLFSSLVLVAIKNTYIPKAQKEPLIALSFLFDSSIFGFPSSRDIFSSLSFPIGTAVYHVSSWPPMISLLLFCGSSSNDPAFLWSASTKSVHPDVVSRRYVFIPSGIPSGVSLTIALNFAGCYQSPAL